jgi:hypothetical protein
MVEGIDPTKHEEAFELVAAMFPGLIVILTIANDKDGDTITNVTDEALVRVLKGMLAHRTLIDHELKATPMDLQ